MILGFSLLIIGIITFFWVSSNYQKGIGDRPLIFNQAYFVILVTVFYVLLILLGIVLIFVSSTITGVISLAILIFLYLLLKIITGKKFTKSLLIRSYNNFKASFPEESEKKIFSMVIKARHPDWDDRLIENFINEAENINELAKLITLFERRWSE